MSLDIKLIIFFLLTSILSIYLGKKYKHRDYNLLFLLSFMGLLVHLIHFWVSTVLNTTLVIQNMATKFSLVSDLIIVVGALIVVLKKETTNRV